jgi:hypothetical protein
MNKFSMRFHPTDNTLVCSSEYIVDIYSPSSFLEIGSNLYETDNGDPYLSDSLAPNGYYSDGIKVYEWFHYNLSNVYDCAETGSPVLSLPSDYVMGTPINFDPIYNIQPFPFQQLFNPSDIVIPDIPFFTFPAPEIPSYTEPTPQPIYEQPVYAQPTPEPVYEQPTHPPIHDENYNWYVQPVSEPVYVEPAPIYTLPVEPTPQPIYEQPVYVQPTPEPVYVEPAPIYQPEPTPLPIYEQPVYVQPTPEPVYVTPAPTSPYGIYINEIVVPPVYSAPYTPQPVQTVEPVTYYGSAPVDYSPAPAPVYQEPVYEQPTPQPIYEQPVYTQPTPEPVYVAPAPTVNYEEQNRIQAELDAAIERARLRDIEIQQMIQAARDLEQQRLNFEAQRLANEDAARAAQSETDRQYYMEQARLSEEAAKNLAAQSAVITTQAETAAVESLAEMQPILDKAQSVGISAPEAVAAIKTAEAVAPAAKTLPVSKNLKPYVYAGIGIVVILIVARMISKKNK